MTVMLDQELRDLTGYLLCRVTSAVIPEVNTDLAPLGLRRSTYSALTLVKHYPDLNQSQLAKALGIESPNMVRVIDELERAGLLRRHIAPRDRRTHALRITEQGTALQHEAGKALARSEKAITKHMSERDICRLHRLLRQIEVNLAPDGAAGPD